LRIADFVDALPQAIDGNFTWKQCRFEFFDYAKKSGEVVATTTAARVNFVAEGGAEYVHHYSVGDPERVVPSEDGKSLVFKTDAVGLNKSSNFFVLLQHLENAGLPEGFMDDDFTALEGMVTHNIGIPEPDRSSMRGAPAAGEQRRVRTIAVPDEIIKMPGGKKVAGKPAGKKAAGADGAELVPDALGIIMELVAENGKTKRQDVAAHAIKAKNTPLATFAYKITPAQLAEGGFEVDDAGVITLAE